MAHNLNFVNGKASMAYVGEKPWHGFGTRVEQYMTSAEAITAAGLDYEVQKFPVKYDIPGTGSETFPQHVVTVRMDTKAPLGIVGRDYKVLQNREAFRWVDSLVGIKEAMYETAGALGQGERIWLLVKLPGFVKTLNNDESSKYLLLANGHDGSLGIHIMFTPIRVVCQNTLNVALGSAGRGSQMKFSVYHTENFEVKLEEARKVLGLANQKFAMFEELSQKLTTVKMNDEQFQTYAKAVVFPAKKSKALVDATKPDDEVEEEMSTRAVNIMEKLSELFEAGIGTDIPGVRGTAWGAFNAITEYTDHVRGKDMGKRTNSLLFGSGAQIKQRAWNEALALTK